MTVLLSSTVLYDFKAVASLIHNKSDCMGRARTSPELWFREAKILEAEIMLYVTLNTTLSSMRTGFPHEL